MFFFNIYIILIGHDLPALPLLLYYIMLLSLRLKAIALYIYLVT